MLHRARHCSYNPANERIFSDTYCSEPCSKCVVKHIKIHNALLVIVIEFNAHVTCSTKLSSL